ncbi:MAG: methyltransferase domain-containing protein [Acidobacteria bacterium]|nr:methyltransferase domain-containing protein [Acidobacteriota bacterium]
MGDSWAGAGIERLQRRRNSPRLATRLLRALLPPDPFVRNPKEQLDAPLGKHNLYLGGGGNRVDGYVNLDLFALEGVNVVADAEALPFAGGLFTRVECDAVLEHVRHPERVMREIERVLAPGGYAHIVTPFCHPFHEYPRDYRRFTVDGLKELAGGLKPVASGWRTGPTATMLVFTLEYVKLWLPWRWWRAAVHVGLGWVLFPLRYLDVLAMRSAKAGQIGNHCYLWLRKPEE